LPAPEHAPNTPRRGPVSTPRACPGAAAGNPVREAARSLDGLARRPGPDRKRAAGVPFPIEKLAGGDPWMDLESAE